MQLTFLIDDDPLQQRIVLSELRVLTALYCGWHSPAKQALDRAIDDPTRIEHALEVVAALPSRPRRQVLASLGALTCKGWPTSGMFRSRSTGACAVVLGGYELPISDDVGMNLILPARLDARAIPAVFEAAPHLFRGRFYDKRGAKM